MTTESFIDLRSDTLTKPTAGMRAAMAEAEVGDDVFDEDPTVKRLQDRVAELLGKESALYVPSGTMSNQIAVRCHTMPGDEVLLDETSHIYVWEAGGPAVLSGVTCRPVRAEDGLLDVEQLSDKLRPDNEHYVRTRLICLENTHNRGGGRVYPQDKIKGIAEWVSAHGLTMHLDGARLWNAHIATGLSLAELAEPFDTVSVCFSKGLGAPIGSALVGPGDFIRRARRIRKLFGGGMRQVGVIASAALYAVENHIARLADDHRNAQVIADAFQAVSGLRLVPSRVETNLIWVEVEREMADAQRVVQVLRNRGVLATVLGPQVFRACTHLDVSSEQAQIAADRIRSLAGVDLSAPNLIAESSRGSYE